MVNLPDVAPIIGCVWISVVATVLLIFRRRVVTFLLRLAAPQESVDGQRRDIGIGVALVAVFAYVLAATLTAMSLLPSGEKAWPLAVGLPVAALVSLLYWLRFANAGISLTGWQRR